MVGPTKLHPPAAAQQLLPALFIWDFENIRVDDVILQPLVKRIREVVSNDVGKVSEKAFLICCDVRNLSPNTTRIMNKLKNVDIVHVDSMEKNAADEKIKQKLHQFDIDFREFPGSSPENRGTIVLISGDGGFAYFLSNMSRSGWRVVVFYGGSFGRELQDVTDAQHDLQFVFDELNNNSCPTRMLRPLFTVIHSSHILVKDLPSDVSLDKVVGRLQQLNEKYGGKVRYINSYSREAILEFQSEAASKNAFERVLQGRISRDIFGFELTVVSIRDPIAQLSRFEVTAAEVSESGEFNGLQSSEVSSPTKQEPYPKCVQELFAQAEKAGGGLLMSTPFDAKAKSVCIVPEGISPIANFGSADSDIQLSLTTSSKALEGYSNGMLSRSNLNTQPLQNSVSSQQKNSASSGFASASCSNCSPPNNGIVLAEKSNERCSSAASVRHSSPVMSVAARLFNQQPHHGDVAKVANVAEAVVDVDGLKSPPLQQPLNVNSRPQPSTSAAQDKQPQQVAQSSGQRILQAVPRKEVSGSCRSTLQFNNSIANGRTEGDNYSASILASDVKADPNWRSANGISVLPGQQAFQWKNNEKKFGAERERGNGNCDGFRAMWSNADRKIQRQRSFSSSTSSSDRSAVFPRIVCRASDNNNEPPFNNNQISGSLRKRSQSCFTLTSRGRSYNANRRRRGGRFRRRSRFAELFRDSATFSANAGQFRSDNQQYLLQPHRVSQNPRGTAQTFQQRPAIVAKSSDLQRASIGNSLGCLSDNFASTTAAQRRQRNQRANLFYESANEEAARNRYGVNAMRDGRARRYEANEFNGYGRRYSGLWEHCDRVESSSGHRGDFLYSRSPCKFYPQCVEAAAKCTFAHPFCGEFCRCPPHLRDPQLNHKVKSAPR